MDRMNDAENRGVEVAEIERNDMVEPGIELKADSFTRLSIKRVNATMKQIELISNLSGGSYEYTEEQVNKIFDTLQESLDNAKAKFLKTKQTKKAFSFDD